MHGRLPSAVTGVKTQDLRMRGAFVPQKCYIQHMSTKTAHLNVRLEPKLKAQAEKVLAALGTTSTVAVTMFYRQVVLRQGLPFDVSIPNAETAAAMRELDPRGELQGGRMVGASMKKVKRANRKVGGGTRYRGSRKAGGIKASGKARGTVYRGSTADAFASILNNK
jgi:DNA-damage-inducible protein J